MADAFFTMNGNVRAIGSIRRGANGQPQSLEASIPDGDTAGIHIEGSGSVRFLGVDTPEKNFSLAGSSAQRRLDSAEWEAYLTDPFLPQFGPFDLDTDLANHLRTRIGVGAGINHRCPRRLCRTSTDRADSSRHECTGADLQYIRVFSVLLL